MQPLDRGSLLERLRGIEWDDFEVKEAAGGVPKTAYTTVSAFANTAGGWIVFGVKEAKGLRGDRRLESRATCRTSSSPPAAASTSSPGWSNFGPTSSPWMAARCWRSTSSPARRFDKPIRVKVDKAWFAYIRVAARGISAAHPQEEGRFLRDATTETFDAQVIYGARFDDLDPRERPLGARVTRDRHLVAAGRPARCRVPRRAGAHA
jgi:ATP-dependent DNA helicase RecG